MHSAGDAGQRRSLGPAPLIAPVAATAAGILIARMLEDLSGTARGAGIGHGSGLAIAAVALSAWCLLFRRNAVSGMTQFVLLLGLAAAAGNAYRSAWNLVDPEHVARLDLVEPLPVVVRGRLVTEPLHSPPLPDDPLCTFERKPQTRFDLELQAVRSGTFWQPLRGRLEVTVQGRLEPLPVGRLVRVAGRLARFHPPQNPGQFDQAAFQRGRRRWCRLQVFHPAAVVAERREDPIARRSWQAAGRAAIRNLQSRGHRVAATIRQHARRQLATYLSAEHRALAAALLLGERRQLDPELTEQFFTTGTIHLLAISGLHVGILAFGFWLLTLAIGMPRRQAIVAVLLLVALYAWLVAAKTPVVRAALLITIAGWCRLAGRRGSGWNALSAAALLTLWCHPGSLFQPGAQLSFLAVGTLSVWHTYRSRQLNQRERDPLTRLIRKTRPWPVRGLRRLGRAAWEMVLAAFAVWVTSLPLVLYHFHLAAPSATFLNPLLWIPVMAALFGGMGVVVCGGWLPPLAWLASWVGFAGLSLMQTIIVGAQNALPLCWWLPGPSRWWLAGWYLALVGLAWLQIRPRRANHSAWQRPAWQRALVGVLPIWILVGTVTGGVCWPVGRGPEPGWVARIQRGLGRIGPPSCECVFLSVGHGTCVVLHLPDGQTLLYDAGHLGCPDSVERLISGYLWQRRVQTLEAIVLSHADADHLNAIPALLKKFPVGKLYVSAQLGAALQSERVLPEAVQQLRTALRRAGTPLVVVGAGSQLEAHDGKLKTVGRRAPLRPGRARLAFEFPRGDVEQDEAAQDEVGAFASENERSLVLRMTVGRWSVLLPGDLEDDGLRQWLKDRGAPCDILMAPHHGRADGSLAALLNVTRPQLVVASCGERQAPAWQSLLEGHPARLAITAREGAIRVRLRGPSFDVHHFPGGRWQPFKRTRVPAASGWSRRSMAK